MSMCLLDAYRVFSPTAINKTFNVRRGEHLEDKYKRSSTFITNKIMTKMTMTAQSKRLSRNHLYYTA